MTQQVDDSAEELFIATAMTQQWLHWIDFNLTWETFNLTQESFNLTWELLILCKRLLISPKNKNILEGMELNG